TLHAGRFRSLRMKVKTTIEGSDDLVTSSNSQPTPRRADRDQSTKGGGWWATTLLFLLGFATVVLIAVIAWPFLPRKYESTATIVLRASDVSRSSLERPEPLRQELNEAALHSEIDRISSSALISP